MSITESSHFTALGKTSDIKSDGKKSDNLNSFNHSDNVKCSSINEPVQENKPSQRPEVPNSLQIVKSGITMPIMCSTTGSSIKLDEITKIVMEKDEDSCFYDVFVSSTSYPCTLGSFNKDKTIEDYQNKTLPMTHLGIVEKKLDDGVLSFVADDKTTQYLDEFMCSCKIDYGALRELFIAMSCK